MMENEYKFQKENVINSISIQAIQRKFNISSIIENVLCTWNALYHQNKLISLQSKWENWICANYTLHICTILRWMNEMVTPKFVSPKAYGMWFTESASFFAELYYCIDALFHQCLIKNRIYGISPSSICSLCGQMTDGVKTVFFSCNEPQQQH